jgi:hypothetical protein
MNDIDRALIAAISASAGNEPITTPKRRYGCSLVPVAYSSDDEPVQAVADARPRLLFADRISTVAESAA